MPRTYEIHSRLEWMRQKDEEAKARQREGKKMRAYIISAYNSRNEVRPDHKWYNLDKASVDKQICDIANQVKAQIAHARDGDKEMESFKKFVEDLQKVLLGEYTEAALVGMQGVGKSLLVNALFDRRNLSKTSAGGSACTAVAVRYLHKPEADDHSDDYDAEVQFMDDQNLEEIVQEHARRYHFYHFELQDDEEHSADDEKAADTALEFFQLVFDTVNSEANLSRLDKLLSSTAIRDGSLATETIQRALERIEQAGADTDRKRTFKNLDEADFIRLIGAYIAPSKDSPPLWPIVQYINLYLGSALARNRVAVIDSPGLGDINQSRLAATNAIRRKAQFEIIAAKSERVITDDAVHRQIKQSVKAHGAKNTILVLTKIDEYLVDKHHIETEIQNSRQHPFPEIRACQADANEALERILDSDEDGRDIADDERKVQRLYDYLEYLTQMAQIAFIETRADAVAIEMRGAFKNLDPDPIEVFSVSAGRYMDWMKAHQQTRPVLSPEMTGIPGLRKLLLSIAADRNWEAYRHHTFSKLPSLNKKISRITDENKKDDAYAIIRPDFGKQVAECKTRQLNAFRNFIEKGIPDVWTDAGIKDQKYRDINEIVKGWHKGLGWKTYDKAVRENGIVLKTKSAKFKTDGAQFNWNEDIGEEIYDQMGSWKKRMDQAVAEFAEEFGNITAEACEKISRSISESSLVPQLKDIAIEDWGEREEAVIEHSAELEGILGEEVDAIYEYATTETDIRCMIARANREIFEKAAQGPRGKGMYQAQQQTIKTKFRRRDEHGDNIVERLEKTVLERTKENLDYSFAEFLQAHIDEFELFEEQIGDRLPADYEMTPHDRQIRVALRYMLPDLHESIEKVQAHFDPDKNSGHSTSSEIGPPPKKQKVDHCSGTKATEIETPQWLSYWGSIFGPGSSNTA